MGHVFVIVVISFLFFVDCLECYAMSLLTNYFESSGCLLSGCFCGQE